MGWKKSWQKKIDHSISDWTIVLVTVVTVTVIVMTVVTVVIVKVVIMTVVIVTVLIVAVIWVTSSRDSSNINCNDSINCDIRDSNCVIF